MKKYTISFYKFIFALLLLVFFLLIYENYMLLINITSKSAAVNNMIKAENNERKKYGYSDILSYLLEDSNIDIIGITAPLEDKELVGIEIEYHGNIEELYNRLEDDSKNENFCYVDNIKIEVDLTGKKRLYSTIWYLKNK